MMLSTSKPQPPPTSPFTQQSLSNTQPYIVYKLIAFSLLVEYCYVTGTANPGYITFIPISKRKKKGGGGRKELKWTAFPPPPPPFLSSSQPPPPLPLTLYAKYLMSEKVLYIHTHTHTQCIGSVTKPSTPPLQ